MKNFIFIAQIIVSAILIFLILIQQKRGQGLVIGENYLQRRGLEKIVFFLTIFLGILFCILSLLALFLK